MTTVADKGWVTDPARVFPVRIDPTVVFGTVQDLGCYIVPSGAPDAPGACSFNTGTDNEIKYGNTTYERHALLRFGEFDLSNTPIPANAVVRNARLDLTVASWDHAEGMLSSVYRVWQDFTTAATWTDSGTGSWPAGGALGQTPVDTFRIVPSAVGQVVSFYPTRLLSWWLSGQYPHQGMAITLDPASTSTNTVGFYGFANAANHPTLTIDWSPTVGQQPWVGAYDHQLTDRMDLHVDYGSRNLVLNNTDETMSAPGQALTVRRTYNSIPAAAGDTGDLGAGWSVNGGVDVSLDINRSAVVLTQPGGAQAVFFRNFSFSDLSNDQAYHDAPGVNATLTMPDSTHYKLKFHKSGIIDTFTLPAADADHANLTSVQDRNHSSSSNGNTTTWSIDGSEQTSKVTDTTGNRYVSFTYDGSRISSAAETLNGGTAGRSWGYGYDSSDNLIAYTDPAGHDTTYCYTGHLLTTIITPRGVANGSTCTSATGIGITKISYDSSGKVTSITYVNGDDTTVQKLTFSTAGTIRPNGTAVTRLLDPYLQETDYRYDTSDRITTVTDPLGDTRANSYNSNNDVTAAVSANNYTGGTNDPSTTATYDGNNNRTQVTLPTGANAKASYDAAAAQPYLPTDSTDDITNKTDYSYDDGGNTIETTLNSHAVENKFQGQSGVSCGPNGGNAYPGALCETRDPDYDATTSTAEHRTAFSYNAMGELVSVTPAQPDHGRTTPPAITASYDSYSHHRRHRLQGPAHPHRLRQAGPAHDDHLRRRLVHDVHLRRGRGQDLRGREERGRDRHAHRHLRL